VIGQTVVEEIEFAGPIAGAPTRGPKSYWRESWERLVDNRVGLFAGGLILLLAVIAIMAPVISAFVTHFGFVRMRSGCRRSSPRSVGEA
jgi:hypothetical protein